MQPMQEKAERNRQGLAWGLIGSVLLHVLPVVLLLIHWPVPYFEPPKEEAVSVEVVPEPEPEKPAEAEKPAEPEKPPEPEKPEEQPPPPPPAPAATMLAVPPPVSDAPERDDALGDTKPQAEPSPIETGPKAEAGDRQDVAPASGDPVPEAAVPAETPPKAEDTAEDNRDQADDGAIKAPDAPDILAAPSDSAEGGDAVAAAPQHLPVPEPRPQPPVSGAKGKTPGIGQTETLKPAEKLLSNARLADPMMREALGQLPRPRRIVQLCTVEALSQIMATRPGTMLHGMVPFGDEDGKIENDTLTATGGAYRTMAGEWFDISFRCSVNVEKMQVTGFNFRLGDHKLTRDERVARGLPAE